MRPDDSGVSKFEKGYWTAAVVVTAAVLALTAIEGLRGRGDETFAEQMERIAGALPPVDAGSPPTRDEILASGPGSELSALGREGVDFIFERVEASRGEEAAKWLKALAFYTQKHLHTERIARYLVGEDEALGRAAADVLAVALEEEDGKENARSLQHRYGEASRAVKGRMLAALASLRAQGAGVVMLDGLSDSDEGVRLAACEAAGRFVFDDEGGRIRERLSALAAGDASEQVREAATRAVGNYPLE